MKKPISLQLHQELTRKYWEPFHLSIREMYEKFGASPNRRVFQIDAHSMPSVGTDKHRDPGERRAQVVVSDQNGISCDRDFRDLVVSSYERAGFEVKLNWPYLGGRLTQTYGKPEIGQNCIQVELNRDLYMNEVSKKLKPEAFREISVKLVNALTFIKEGLSQF